MNHSPLLAAATLSFLLSACGTQPQAPVSQRGGQLELALGSGTYGCGHGERILVERDVRDQVNYRLHINWQGRHYRLERNASSSGLPRFEDSASGLVWIDLPTNSLLLDSRTNTPLANECKRV